MDQNVTLEQFPQFSALPTELRLMIWRFAVVPRMVRFPERPMQKITRWYKTSPECLFLPDLNNTPLALLGVCQESREEIGSLYRQIFAFTAHWQDLGRVAGDRWQSEDIQNITFNSRIDTLMISQHMARMIAKPGTDDLHALQYVAVEINWWVYTSNLPHIRLVADTVLTNFPEMVGLFLKCPNLEQLCLYFDQELTLVDWKEEGLKVIVEPLLKGYIRKHLNFQEPDSKDEKRKLQGEEGRDDAKLSDEHLRLRELCRRWDKVACVKSLAELKAERGVV